VKWSLWCALAALGCADAGTDATGRASAPLEPTTRDSSGVTIHEHPADALERAPLITMDTVPLVTFVGDLLDPRRDISTISWLAFTESGDLVGYETTESQFVALRVADGSQRRYGRKGSGPLEIGYGSYFLPMFGDTVLFKDQRNNRLVVAHPDTGLLRTIAMSEVPGLGNWDYLARLGDSLLMLERTKPPQTEGPPPNGLVRHERLLGLWRPGWDSVRVLSSRPTPPIYQVVRVFAPGTWGTTGRGLVLAGSMHVTGWQHDFGVASATKWEIERWDTAGGLTSVVRINKAPTLVTDELYDSAVEDQLNLQAQYDSTLNLDSARAALRAIPRGDTLGVFYQVSATPQGRLWLVDYRRGRDSGWAATLLDGEGHILGRIVEPSGPLPRAFGNDRLAFRTEDEDGIATITVRRLRLPE
jgi:hypothetical protein